MSANTCRWSAAPRKAIANLQMNQLEGGSLALLVSAVSGGDAMHYRMHSVCERTVSPPPLAGLALLAALAP